MVVKLPRLSLKFLEILKLRKAYSATERLCFAGVGLTYSKY